MPTMKAIKSANDKILSVQSPVQFSLDGYNNEGQENKELLAIVYVRNCNQLPIRESVFPKEWLSKF